MQMQPDTSITRFGWRRASKGRMPSAGFFLIAAAGLAVLLLFAKIMRSWLRMRGLRVVTCPETGRKAGVMLDARRAALTGALSGPEMRLASCTRWPEKRACGQECLSEVAQAGEGCLVRSILTAWYAGKRCANCAAFFGEIDWIGRKPGLMDPSGATIEWAQVRAEDIDAVLASHRPVCFACHTTNLFVRQHPELIVDRTRAANQRG